MYEDTRGDGFGDEVKRRIMLGTYALSSGYYDALYGKAQRVRTKIAEDFANAFEKVDVIVTPTSPSVAFKLGERTDDPYSMYLSDYFTVPMSLAGIPALSIPGGLSEGLPVGIQLAGPAFSEGRLLDAGARAGAGHRLRREPGPWLSRPTPRAGHRPGDPRPAQDAHQDVLRLRAVLRRRAQHPHLPGVPGSSRARCR